MTRGVKTVTRDRTMRDIIKMFESEDFNGCPVVEGGHVIGFVTKFDCLNCFAFRPNVIVPHYNDLMQKAVGDVMTSEFIYVAPSTKLTRVLQLMVEHRLRSVPVIDAEYRLMGIISRSDVMRALDRCSSDIN